VAFQRRRPGICQPDHVLEPGEAVDHDPDRKRADRLRARLEDPWLTKSSQNDQNSGGDQTSVNVHLESLLELAPSYGE